MKPLQKPLPVSFYLLDGKHTMEKPFFGGLVSIGHDIASLETMKLLKILDNIQMDAGGKLMCKVVEKKENDIYILHYTSIPSGFESWISERSKQ